MPGTRSLGYVIAADGAAVIAFATPGDANLNGQVDVFDLVAIGGGGDYGTGAAAAWATGDVNYDGQANIFDVVGISASGAYGVGPYHSLAITAVPEPAFGWPLAIAAGSCLPINAGFRRR